MKSLAIYIAALGFALAAWAQTNPADEPFRRIDVQGRAEISKTVDRAELSFTVEAEADTPSEATEGLAIKSSEAMTILAAAGVSEDLITTSDLDMGRVSRDEDKDEYYRASYSVNVEINDFDAILPIMQAFVDAEVENYGSIRYFAEFTEDEAAALNQESVQDAYDEARFYAEATGMKLGNPIMIQIGRFEGGDLERSYSRDYEANAYASGDIPLDIGEVNMGANATIRYELLAE